MPSRRNILTGLSFLPVMAALPQAVFSMETNIYAVDGLAIRGADAVAYFADGRMTQGHPEHALMWRGAIWLFASMQNRDMFEMDPNTFAPRFGGYCAYAMAMGELAPSDPAAFTVHDGRLYLNLSMDIRQRWQADMTDMIAAAEANWPRFFAN